GAWRGWLDHEPAGEVEALAEHLAACASCAGLVGELRANAALAATAIDALGPSLAPAAPAAGPFARHDGAGRRTEVAALAAGAHCRTWRASRRPPSAWASRSSCPTPLPCRPA